MPLTLLNLANLVQCPGQHHGMAPGRWLGAGTVRSASVMEERLRLHHQTKATEPGTNHPQRLTAPAHPSPAGQQIQTRPEADSFQPEHHHLLLKLRETFWGSALPPQQRGPVQTNAGRSASLTHSRPSRAPSFSIKARTPLWPAGPNRPVSCLPVLAAAAVLAHGLPHRRNRLIAPSSPPGVSTPMPPGLLESPGTLPRDPR